MGDLKEDVAAPEEGRRPQFGARYLPPGQEGGGGGDEVFRHNAWDDVEWTDEQLREAEAAVDANTAAPVPAERREQLESEAGGHWDAFYSVHNNRFFKDRNWLFTEMPELSHLHERSDPCSVLELGCGTGSTVFPLLETVRNDRLTVFCCDFSSRAVELVREHPAFRDDGRCVPFVLDATRAADWDSCPLAKNSLDFVLMIFSLSAMEPEGARVAARKAAEYLRPGGVLFFRDYGEHDLAQLRFKSGRCLGPRNFYVRGDNTRCYFFKPEEVEELFAGEAGLEKSQLKVDRRLQVNRGKKLKMYRVWIQAKFVKRKEEDR